METLKKLNMYGRTKHIDFYLGEPIDQFSWTTYFLPFHWKAWLSILILSLGTSVLIWNLYRYHTEYLTLNIYGSFAISFGSIFGITIRDANELGIKISTRLCLFVIFICGSLFVYFYTGFLTSALAVPSKFAPFNSPEGILQTEYRYRMFRKYASIYIVQDVMKIIILPSFSTRVLTGPKSYSLAQVFTTSKPNTVWNEIFKNHMTDKSFKSDDMEATKTMLEKNEYLTQYTEVESMIYNSEPCKIKILWESPSKDRASIAFPKGSPLVPFFKHTYSQIRQTGVLLRLTEKWQKKASQGSCESMDSLEPISINKIISLIALLFFGICLAIIILAIENNFPPNCLITNEPIEESQSSSSLSKAPSMS